MQSRPSWLARLMIAWLTLAIVGVGVLGSAPRTTQAAVRTTTLFKAEFENAPLGALAGPLVVDLGEVVAEKGTVEVGKFDSKALVLNGTAGEASALLQWDNYPSRLPLRTPEELQIRITAEFTTTNTNGGATFGLYNGTELFELFSFGPGGALKHGTRTVLTYKANEKIRLDARIQLDRVKNYDDDDDDDNDSDSVRTRDDDDDDTPLVETGKVIIRLITTGGQISFTVPLEGNFSRNNLNQVRFLTTAGSGATSVDKINIKLERVTKGEPSVIIIRDDDIKQDFEIINGIIFVNISITIVNSGGGANNVFLVLDLDTLKDLDLDDLTFLENIGYVERIDGKQVYIGLGKNNAIGGGDRLKLKIKFKVKKGSIDIRIRGGFKLFYGDSEGGKSIDLPVVIVVPVVVPVPIGSTPVITPTQPITGTRPVTGTTPISVTIPITGTIPRLPITIIDLRFRAIWERRGGLLIFGLPLSGPITLPNGLTVQYFERARLEYHPDLRGTPYEVQFGLLAVELGYARPPSVTAPPANAADRLWYYPATGHVIATPFRNYWRGNGGLALFGLPISPVLTENGLQVQYFERARLEFHPENRGTRYEVLQGLLGEQALRQR
ncbi:MAG: hypothetical protein OHK0022_00870 [Roseiflexaceae bacterium]